MNDPKREYQFQRILINANYSVILHEGIDVMQSSIVEDDNYASYTLLIDEAWTTMRCHDWFGYDQINHKAFQHLLNDRVWLSLVIVHD